jgi:hypothetical protein
MLYLMDLVPHQNMPRMSGPQVRHLMRRVGVTVRQVASANNIPLKAVRRLRNEGAARGLASWEIRKFAEVARNV